MALAGTYATPALAMRWAGRRVRSRPSRRTRPSIGRAGRRRTEQRRLAGAVRAHDRDRLPCGDLEVDVRDDLLAQVAGGEPRTSSSMGLSQVGVDDVGVPHHVLGHALGEDLAEVEDDRRSASWITALITCSTHMIVVPSSSRTRRAMSTDAASSVSLSRPSPRRAGARAAARERLRELEEPLLMEVEALDRVTGPPLEPDERERLERPPPCLALAHDP